MRLFPFMSRNEGCRAMPQGAFPGGPGNALVKGYQVGHTLVPSFNQKKNLREIKFLVDIHSN